MITRLALLLVAALGGSALAQGTIVVGAVISQTGPHAEQAADYLKGLSLWRDEHNEAGGMLGRKVELRILDDGSEAIRNGSLYLQLMREDKADLLVGPYGTAATMMGSVEAESARRVFINGAGPSRTVHKRSPRYVFQTAVPYNAYGAGVLQIARDEGHKRIFLAARDDPASREMAEGAKEAAGRLGLVAGDIDLYAGGADDFLPQLRKAQAAQADAWIVFGEVRDAAEMIKTLRKSGHAPRFFFVRGASDPDLKSDVGQDAELALGARAYDVRLNTPGNRKFVQAFSAKFGSPPGLAAAEGYAAGTVLAEAVQRAGTLDQAKLRAALATLTTHTVLGEHKVDPLTGEQVAAQASVTQIINGRVELVWPASGATAQRVAPYPQWSERRILRK